MMVVRGGKSWRGRRVRGRLWGLDSMRGSVFASEIVNKGVK
jgi:hypothetical protein